MKRILIWFVFIVLACSLASAISFEDLKPSENIPGLKYTGRFEPSIFEGPTYAYEGYRYVDEIYSEPCENVNNCITMSDVEAYEKGIQIIRFNVDIQEFQTIEEASQILQSEGEEVLVYDYDHHPSPDVKEGRMKMHRVRTENFIISIEGVSNFKASSNQINLGLSKLITDVLSKISKYKEEEKEGELKQAMPSVSVKAPNVITKRVTPGTINVQDGEIVFEISNEDPNHNLEGYLSCDIPSDVIVTGSIGAATGEQAQYIGQTFTVDPAPARESMSLRLSSQNEGSKYIRCSINYVLFKEGKGYVTRGGQYSPDRKYQQITVNRDIQFKEFEGKAKSDIATYWYFIAGVGVVVLLLIIFLVYKLGHISGKVEKKK